MSTQEDIVEIQKARAEITKLWNGKVQPAINRDPRLPAQFIIDVLEAVFAKVIVPIDNLTGALRGNVLIIEQAETFAGIKQIATLIGSDTASSSLTAAINQANSTLDNIVDRALRPLHAEAKAAIASKGKRAMVGVVTTGADRFDQVILVVLQVGANTLLQLQQLKDAASESVLFRFADVMRRGAEAVVAAFQAIGAAIATVGAGFYSIFRTLFLIAKLALIGGAGYIGYRLYQGAQQRKQIAAPQSNPARRRRRSSKRGRRASYYLR